MTYRSSRSICTRLVVITLAAVLGCTDKATEPELERSFPPPPTAPESLVAAIEVIYNDRTHSTSERLTAYESLFDSTFLFWFRPDLYVPPTWPLSVELAAHQNMFAAQDIGLVTSIELHIDYGAATDLDPPQPGREGWQEVFARAVHLRIMFDPYNGLEVVDDPAKFRFPPPINGRYRIAEWVDGTVFALRSEWIESTSWAEIKASYN
jgi:hypothetical protein